MATSINLSHGTIALASTINITGPWRLSVRAKWAGATIHSGDRLNLCYFSGDSFFVSASARVFSTAGDWVDVFNLRINGGAGSVNKSAWGVTPQTVLEDGDFHTIDFYGDGTTTTIERDGVFIGDGANAEPMSGWNQLSQSSEWEIEEIRFYNSTDTSVPLHAWVVADADTSNTGSAPVIPDSVGTNDATADASFPTDGSAFNVEAPPGPTVTTSDTLQPGTEFTLTATNYSSAPASPVTLTDTAGSTITVPVTISGSGPYTATGTMPTLAEAVTAGTSLLFGDVTIELTT